MPSPTKPGARLLRATAAATFAAVAAAGFLLGGGSALAPGPADLKAPLYGYTGATADAVFTNTGVATTVLLWPGVYTSGGSAAAGTPCSTYGMGPGERTKKSIVVNNSGTQRKCV